MILIFCYNRYSGFFDKARRQRCRGAFVIQSCLQFVSDPQNIMLCRVRRWGIFYWRMHNAQAERQEDAAREEYLRRMREDGTVNLAALAEDIGVNYDTVRRWKSKEKGTSWKFRRKETRRPAWEPERRGKPRRRCPPRNKNAQKHGGYAAVFFDQLTDDEKFIMDKTPKTAVKALREELGILKVQEKRILGKSPRWKTRIKMNYISARCLICECRER